MKCHTQTRFLAAVCALAAISVFHRAHAQDFGPYVGFSVGGLSTGHVWNTSRVNVGPTSDETGYKLFGGLRPVDPLAVEFEYVDFGEQRAEFHLVCIAIVGPCPGFMNSLDARALSVSAVGFLDAGPVEIFGRAGIGFWNADRREFFAVDRSEDGSDPVLGIGVQYGFERLSIRAEYEAFDIAGVSTKLTSVGVTFPLGR